MRRGALVAALVAIGAFFALPVAVPSTPSSTVLLDRDGQLLGARLAADEQWRFPLAGEVPDKLATAIVHFEDRRFRWHPGVDPASIGRAVVQNLKAGEVVSGASTLSMQVVRMARGNPARTLPEKLVEAVLAVRLEAALSKDEILATWAAHAPMGGNVVGLEAIAWRSFGRPASELSWAEAATVAVLPNRPALLHLGRSRDELQARRDGLLRSLRGAGALDETELTLALAEPLPRAAEPLPRLAPHLLDRVASGTLVGTTLSADVQARAVEVVERHHEQLVTNGVHNAAALIVELESGEVVARVGNVSAEGEGLHGEHVDVVSAPRSTGSLLKPFLYASLLEAGELLPDELVPDVPVRFGGFAPENFDRRYDGAIAASTALARSRNVPAVQLLHRYGIGRFRARLERLGMSTLFRDADGYGLALILGGAEGTLEELVDLYRGLAWDAAGGGELAEQHWRGSPGVVERAAFDPGAAWLTLEALQEVERPGVQGAWRLLRGSRSVAWKTGTSFGHRDGWAIGVTGRHVVGVWIGNASGEGRPGLTGYEAAAPVLFDLVELVEKGALPEAPREALVEVELCAHSGRRAGPDCFETELGAVPRAALHAEACPSCQLVHCDDDCSHRVDASCASLSEIRTEPWFVLPPAQEALYQRRNSAYRSLPPWNPACEVDADRPLALVYPAPDSRVYVPTELDGEESRVVFQASHREADAELFWHLDDAFVGVTSELHELALAPSPGEHVLTLVDQDGAEVRRRFEVLADQ